MKKLCFLLALMCHGALFAQSEEEITIEELQEQLTEEEFAEYIEYMAYADSVNANIDYQTGTIQLGEGIATLTTPAGFAYVGVKDTKYILSELWGNPPSETYGLLVPEGFNPLGNAPFAVDISFSEEGYVEDDDAEDIDYEELLEELKSDTKLASAQRVKNGYEAVELIGWASAPYYDAEGKKLHWAKEIAFLDGEGDDNTLNYDIRVLGRRGVLSMNAIASISYLETFKQNIPAVLEAVHFNPGHQYKDFDSSMDKVAAIGIGGLVAGKLLAKGGILVLLAKFWKIIAIGAVALFSGIGKFLGIKKKRKQEQQAISSQVEE